MLMLNMWVNRRLRPFSTLFSMGPEFYTKQDEHGRSILHRIGAEIHLKGSYSVPETERLFHMVSDCPASALLLQESEGETILHHFVRRCADGIPGRCSWANKRWLNQIRVWEDLVDLVLERCPETAEVQNREGNTPLHIAVKRTNQWSAHVTQKLASTRPAASEMENEAGETPLASLCRLNSTGFRRALGDSTSREDIFGGSLGGMAPLSGCVLSQINALLEASMKARGIGWESCESERNMVLACLAMHNCPSDLIQLAIKMYPHQPFGSDEKGNYGLHLASANPIVQDGLSKKVLESLVEQNSLIAAASNESGQYPLHSAAYSGKHWDEGISALLNAAPHLVGEKDSEKGMFPFMLAACSPVDRKGVPQEKKLDTIYRLLRMLPEMERF